MGFHRRIINEEVTRSFLYNRNLDDLYIGDSIILMDDFSSKVRELHRAGKTNDEILEILKIEKNEDN